MTSGGANLHIVGLEANTEPLVEQGFSDEGKVQRAAAGALHRVPMNAIVLVEKVVIDVVARRGAVIRLKCHGDRRPVQALDSCAKLSADITDVVLLVERNQVAIEGRRERPVGRNDLIAIGVCYVEPLKPESSQRPEFDWQSQKTLRPSVVRLKFDFLSIIPPSRRTRETIETRGVVSGFVDVPVVVVHTSVDASAHRCQPLEVDIPIRLLHSNPQTGPRRIQRPVEFA